MCEIPHIWVIATYYAPDTMTAGAGDQNVRSSIVRSRIQKRRSNTYPLITYSQKDETHHVLAEKINEHIYEVSEIA